MKIVDSQKRAERKGCILFARKKQIHTFAKNFVTKNFAAWKILLDLAL
jgi:hypothetical protein